MDKKIVYTDEQRRQLNFLCRQAQALEAVVNELPPDSKEYSAQMRTYLATTKQIDSLRHAVESAAYTDALLAFAPAGDAK